MLSAHTIPNTIHTRLNHPGPRLRIDCERFKVVNIEINGEQKYKPSLVGDLYRWNGLYSCTSPFMIQVF